MFAGQGIERGRAQGHSRSCAWLDASAARQPSAGSIPNLAFFLSTPLASAPLLGVAASQAGRCSPQGTAVLGERDLFLATFGACRRRTPRATLRFDLALGICRRHAPKVAKNRSFSLSSRHHKPGGAQSQGTAISTCVWGCRGGGWRAPQTKGLPL